MFITRHYNLILSRNYFSKLANSQRNGYSRRKLSVKQLVYSEYGNPTEVIFFKQVIYEIPSFLKVIRLETRNIDENTLQSNQVLVKWQASPINPSDINQIQGGSIPTWKSTKQVKLSVRY